MSCQHEPMAIGHAIICRFCLAPLQSWGVTTPIVGEPKVHEYPTDTVAIENVISGTMTQLLNDAKQRRVN